MLAAPMIPLPSVLIRRALVGLSGVVVLAVAFFVSVVLRQPRVFTLVVPLAGGLILAQGVFSMVWLNARRLGRPLWPAWLVWAQAGGALICLLVLAWVFWLRT